MNCMSVKITTEKDVEDITEGDSIMIETALWKDGELIGESRNIITAPASGGIGDVWQEATEQLEGLAKLDD